MDNVTTLLVMGDGDDDVSADGSSGCCVAGDDVGARLDDDFSVGATVDPAAVLSLSDDGSDDHHGSRCPLSKNRVSSDCCDACSSC